MENDPPNRSPSKKFPGDDGNNDDEAVLMPLQELQITSSSADVSFRTDRKALIRAGNYCSEIYINPELQICSQ